MNLNKESIENMIDEIIKNKKIPLNEISDSAKQKAKDKFKKQNPNLTNHILDYYINIFSDKQSSNAFQKKDIMQYTFSELENIVDANFPRKESSVDIDNSNFRESEDVIYDNNKLLILIGDLKDKCVRYGTGKSWCISRKDTSNMFFKYRMRMDEPVFYFVFDEEKEETDKYHAIVIYVNNQGEYMVADSENEGDESMEWSEIELIQPKLKGLQGLFKHIPLTEEEKKDYEKFKNKVSDYTYEDFNYTERFKYIGFGHDLTESQIRMTWNIRNQRPLISKYVTTTIGRNLPKEIESKLPNSDKSKMYKNRIKDKINNGDPFTDDEFEWCDDETKKQYIDRKIQNSRILTDYEFEWCDDRMKKRYIAFLFVGMSRMNNLTEYQFELCDDNLKKFYINEKMYERKLFDFELEWCDDDMKKEYIENGFGSLSITDNQFNLFNDTLKKLYANNRIKKGRKLTDHQQNWYDANKENIFENIIDEIIKNKKTPLNEISDSAKQKAKDKFKKQNPNLTDGILDYYVNIFSDKQSSNAFQKKDIMQYTFSELEKIVDANFPRKESSVDIDNSNFRESEDVIYDNNKLLILLGDLKDKCVRYGVGKSWCISRKDTSNMFFSYRMRMDEPVFYFVFDEEKEETDKYHAIVIYINSKGEYMVANSKNEGDENMSWSEIELIQPKLKGLQGLFKHIPLTEEEREDHEKFYRLVSDDVYENFNYTERFKYIGFGHDLSEAQIRMTWNIPNQKSLISKYVTTTIGKNLPKDIESKLPNSDKVVMFENKISRGYRLSYEEFNWCDDKMKKFYLEKRINHGKDLSYEEFNWLDVEMKNFYLDKKLINYDNSYDNSYDDSSDDFPDYFPDYEFEWLDDERKKEYIDKKIINSNNLTDYEFDWCDDEMKRKYIYNRIKYGGHILNDYEFDWCDNKMKIRYINVRIYYKGYLTPKELDRCNIFLKKYYDKIKPIIKKISNHYTLTDDEFKLCDDEMKKIHLYYIVHYGYHLTDYQQNWYDTNKGNIFENIIDEIIKNKKTLLNENKGLDKKIVKSFKTKENLSKDIFELKDGEYAMNKDVRKKLLEITDNFMDFLGVEFFIHDIVLTGSLSNYSWSNFSDVDLHILIDFEDAKYDSKLLKEFFNSKKGLWNEMHNIKIKNYDVELYVQDVDEPHVSSGIYSILNDKWNSKPKKGDSKINEKKIIEKGEEYGNLIDKVVSSSKKKDVTKEIEKINKKIKKFRQCGLESGGEQSIENLTFKLLRRNGYIKKLLDLKKTLTDKKLSITQ